MSMRDYAVQDIGLVLDKETLKNISRKLYAEEYETKEDFNEAFEEDPYGFFEDVESKFGLSSCCNFTGEAIVMTDDGLDDWGNSIDYHDDSIYYLPIMKRPSLFKVAYNSIEEVVAEFKETLGDFLPEDFDYKKQFRLISGTYFG